jgi:hypothetical protein
VQEGRISEQVDLDGFAIACCLGDGQDDLFVTVAQSLDPGVEVTDAVYKKRTRARILRLGRVTATDFRC